MFLKKNQFSFKNGNNYPTTTVQFSIGKHKEYCNFGSQAPVVATAHQLRNVFFFKITDSVPVVLDGHEFLKTTIFLLFLHGEIRGSCWVVVGVFKEK